MNNGMPVTSIVIPTYNAVGQVESLLTRLRHFHQKYENCCQIIVTDDASGDGTASEIKREFPEVEVVEHDFNTGFGSNVMRGVKQAHGEYLAIVNSDIELIGNPIKPLINELEQDPNLFAAMPLVYNRNLDKVENLQRLMTRRGLVWNTDLPDAEEWTSALGDLLTSAGTVKDRLKAIAGQAAPVPSLLCGAIFVCRRDRFLQLEGFDPRFTPFYWEDVDLDYRARRQGWRSVVVPRAAVIHRHSETIDRHFSRTKLKHLRLNQLRFVVNHLKQLPELSQPHLWWGMRAVRELFGGIPELRSAYWRASLGIKNF